MIGHFRERKSSWYDPLRKLLLRKKGNRPQSSWVCPLAEIDSIIYLKLGKQVKFHSQAVLILRRLFFWAGAEAVAGADAIPA